MGRMQDGAGQRKKDQMLSVVETNVKTLALWLEKREFFSLVALEQMLNQLEKRFSLG